AYRGRSKQDLRHRASGSGRADREIGGYVVVFLRCCIDGSHSPRHTSSRVQANAPRQTKAPDNDLLGVIFRGLDFELQSIHQPGKCPIVNDYRGNLAFDGVNELMVGRGEAEPIVDRFKCGEVAIRCHEDTHLHTGVKVAVSADVVQVSTKPGKYLFASDGHFLQVERVHSSSLSPGVLM